MCDCVHVHVCVCVCVCAQSCALTEDYDGGVIGCGVRGACGLKVLHRVVKAFGHFGRRR